MVVAGFSLEYSGLWYSADGLVCFRRGSDGVKVEALGTRSEQWHALVAAGVTRRAFPRLVDVARAASLVTGCDDRACRSFGRYGVVDEDDGRRLPLEVRRYGRRWGFASTSVTSEDFAAARRRYAAVLDERFTTRSRALEALRAVVDG